MGKRAVTAPRLPMTDPQRLTRLVGNSRLADRYLSGRVLLAGDAAHVFGLSLNAGLLDAVNLGWKLAAQVQGRAPGGLLESYHAERHLAGQHGIRYTRAQGALTAISEGGKDGPGEVSQEGAEALRELFGDVLQQPEPLRHIRELLRQPRQLRRIGELIEGSDVRYPVPAGSAPPHPLLGTLAPDLQLENPPRPHPGRRAHASGPRRPARPHHRLRGRRASLRLARPAHRHHRTLPDQARTRCGAADQARRPRRLGHRPRHTRPGRRAEPGPAYLAQPPGMTAPRPTETVGASGKTPSDRVCGRILPVG
ncbi:MAG TPA: FAD-dependent monooxygenase [Streptosporangiaceae bacterium]